MPFCYFNKKIISEKKASVSLRDLGLLRGYGVFEVLTSHQQELFLFKEHFKRLQNSAKELRLKLPVSEKKLELLIRKLLVKNKLAEASIRIVLTGGVSQDGITLGKKPTLFILVNKIHRFKKSNYLQGVKLMTVDYQREIPRAKISNYTKAIKLQKEKDKRGAIEILYTHQGLVLEASTSSFFIFKGNTLITPKNNILLGTVRGFILKIARQKFKIQERDLRLEELKKADEAFLTATIKEIMPVVKVDNFNIGDGKVGENTKWLMEEFKKKQ
ncbi:MAG: aminotransferase class IV [Patescibacteria group bacterium]|nr:aminotransferase class IV [Patescibacteria group bacterium]